MEERYSRNRLYVSEREQSIIKDYKIFLGGAGIGSIIAECALRFGFEYITELMLGHNIACTVFARKSYILDICTRNKPAQILRKKQHTSIRRAIIFHIKESE